MNDFALFCVFCIQILPPCHDFERKWVLNVHVTSLFLSSTKISASSELLFEASLTSQYILTNHRVPTTPLTSHQNSRSVLVKKLIFSNHLHVISLCVNFFYLKEKHHKGFGRSWWTRIVHPMLLLWKPNYRMKHGGVLRRPSGSTRCFENGIEACVYILI